MRSEPDVRLRASIEHARASTPFYADYPSLPAEQLDCYLHELPLLSRQQIRLAGARLHSRGEDTRSWKVLRTTGTTDEPLDFIVDEYYHAASVVTLTAQIDRCLGRSDWTSADLLHLTLHAGSDSRARPAPWNPAARAVKWNLLQAWQASDVAFHRTLCSLEGHIVTTLPSVAELLADRLEVSGLTPIRPAVVLLSGQLIEPATFAKVSRVFGCPVSSLYTLTEAGNVGTECLADGGYHIEDEHVFVEVVGSGGRPITDSEEGEVVVTPFNNRAMPLLRYRTGDRGHWIAGPCRCGRATPRLKLTSARRPSRLVATSGRSVNVLRFAKLLAALNVEQFAVRQDEHEAVTVSYRATQPLDPASRAVVAAAVRLALGPRIPVEIQRGIPADDPFRSTTAVTRAEPALPDLTDLAPWLQEQLGTEPDLQAAVLIGSFLNPEDASRFSDIDLVLLLTPQANLTHWLNLARGLNAQLQKLSVMPHFLPGLADRAALFACRLRWEQRIVLGTLPQEFPLRPSFASLFSQALYCLQAARMQYWHRLSTPAPLTDPVRDSWTAAKEMLNALRYFFLLQGYEETIATEVIARARSHPVGTERWFAHFEEIWLMAREHLPPRIPSRSAQEWTFRSALECLTDIALRIEAIRPHAQVANAWAPSS